METNNKDSVHEAYCTRDNFVAVPETSHPRKLSASFDVWHADTRPSTFTNARMELKNISSKGKLEKFELKFFDALVSVQYIKLKLEEITGINHKGVEFFCSGKKLRNENTLVDYGIHFGIVPMVIVDEDLKLKTNKSTTTSNLSGANNHHDEEEKLDIVKAEKKNVPDAIVEEGILVKFRRTNKDPKEMSTMVDDELYFNLDFFTNNAERSVDTTLAMILKAVLEMNNQQIKVLPWMHSLYYEELIRIMLIEEAKKPQQEVQAEAAEAEQEDFYVSGCVLNYHIRCMKHMKTQEDLQRVAQEAKTLISKYGKKLQRHPLYWLNQYVPNRKAFEKDQEIRRNLRAQKNPNLLNIDILTSLTKNMGTTLLLTDQEGPKELELYNSIVTDTLSKEFITVTFEDMNEIDLEKMAKDKNYAMQSYEKAKKTLKDSEIFKINDISDMTIAAVECNSPLKFIILLKEEIRNLCNKQALITEKVFIGRKIVQCYTEAWEFNIFDPQNRGNRYWSLLNPFNGSKRAGLKYYYPKGWRGQGLNVWGKYENIEWLRSDSRRTWVVAYRALYREEVTCNDEGHLINEGLANAEQIYEMDVDINKRNNNNENDRVGKGYRFEKKVPAPNITAQIEEEGSVRYYQVVFQYKLDPRKIRIPTRNRDIYIVPEHTDARPYRMLVKEAKGP